MPAPSAPSPRAYERLVDDLSSEVGVHAAVSWAHAGAVVRHATEHRLVAPVAGTPGPDHTRRVLAALAAAHPALESLEDPQVAGVWEDSISPAGWERITQLWNQVPLSDEGHRVDGYRLGDAYQALSADARKARALCQTPVWVADLLLALSVEPALDAVGPDQIRMIDPSCGTGHILLAAFHRIRAHRPRGRSPHRAVTRQRGVERALQAVHGVDLDVYAAALARYRLLATSADLLGGPISAVPAAWPVQVAAADALLSTDEPLLRPGRYHAVVGNPPYITVRDAQLREQVRRSYPEVCSGKYSLALPFTVLMTRLAAPAGTVAQLTANSFMKREFGRKFIEQYLPQVDLTWVIDTSGAYIPGHGTPTVIMVHRAQPPQGDSVITVRGNRGEPRVPQDPAQGLVWRAIEEAVHERLDLERLRKGMEAHRREQQFTTTTEVA
ncbi:Eco57I restriction-modification methylase domain-containing protein [Streptomyces sp. RKAG337]|uniref:Eco57I restriction-modification methylase domain-containing protein n=1 Tax=Streptomyces sp. RKAG337 TaxID=2893404 RepID=UPI0020345E63|nr:N-6 DNA methylase [Streptomyces sp. RKAG337]MCM2430922.1 N-6 DNA methylase [Streptomyces sp. RKAG337]